jgi:hypothetical protein
MSDTQDELLAFKQREKFIRTGKIAKKNQHLLRPLDYYTRAAHQLEMAELLRGNRRLTEEENLVLRQIELRIRVAQDRNPL